MKIKILAIMAASLLSVSANGGSITVMEAGSHAGVYENGMSGAIDLTSLNTEKVPIVEGDADFPFNVGNQRAEMEHEPIVVKPQYVSLHYITPNNDRVEVSLNDVPQVSGNDEESSRTPGDIRGNASVTQPTKPSAIPVSPTLPLVLTGLLVLLVHQRARQSR